MKSYTTIQGDMWDSIAYKTFGAERYAPDIMRVNRQYLKFYTFPAGILLTIPDEISPSVTSAVLPPWKGPAG